MFVTRGRFTTGVAVADDASCAQLGDAILQLYSLASEAYRDEGVSWRSFCEDVAGVPVQRYRPEKSARVFLSDGTWHAAVDPFGPEAEMPSAADIAHELGAMVRRVLDAVPPRWPTIHQAAIVTSAVGRLIVMPVVRGFSVGPAYTADPDAGSLLAAVRAALPASERGENPGYAEALAAAGVDWRLLDGGATVHLESCRPATSGSPARAVPATGRSPGRPGWAAPTTWPRCAPQRCG
ncbi:hypothetical protein [Actinoplanes palleronii]|uniref:hypothetical protein n=1 Tax=Actinoplanes palleronii TaxID=113570 RepID=UPI001944058F|nr:hypothetical protein [Actinoplanes palleronii]